VLRIMNDATNGTEDRGECHRIQEKKDRYQATYLPHTMLPRCDFRSPTDQGCPISERALCARCGIPRSPDSQALVCPGNSRVEICGIPHLAKNERDTRQLSELDGEGRRRSAGSGAAKYTGCDSVRNQLLVDIGDGKVEAGAGREIRRDSNRGDSAKTLPKWAGCLAQRRPCVRGVIGHRTQDAGVSAVSATANGKQLLRGGEREHSRRRQQCPENAQQHDCCDPPHAVSVHAPVVPGTAAVFAV
jgi:hypothetical protein